MWDIRSSKEEQINGLKQPDRASWKMALKLTAGEHSSGKKTPAHLLT
jgi:hypothetical protein